MFKVEAIVREDKYEDVKDALDSINVNGMTISQVMGCGAQKGYNEAVRNKKDDLNVLPKIKFEIIVSSQEMADKTVDVICRSAYTGNYGDGKILVYEIKDAVRIRTGERGEQAL
jgi:nitrogen regulatory protein P-II 1